MSDCPVLANVSTFYNTYDELRGWDIYFIGLEKLDASNCAAMKYLICNEDLEELNVSGCTGLKSLHFHDSIKELNIKGCSALEELKCSRSQQKSSQLKKIDVSGMTALISLDCAYSGVREIDVNGCTALKCLECNDTPNMTSLNVSGLNALVSLLCGFSGLKELNVNGCNALQYLDCNDTKLKEINVSGLKALTTLYCTYYSYNSSSELEKLNASGCTALTELYCGTGKLVSLNVNGCTSLKQINNYDNEWDIYASFLTDFDARNCSAVASIKLRCENMEELDLNGCTSLEYLACECPNLTKLSVNGCKLLEYLQCSNAQLTELSMKGCDALAYLFCERNKLKELDITGLHALLSLNCESNDLEELDASSCTKLKTIHCELNYLVSLDVTGLTALTELHCHDNKLKELDVTSNTALAYLYCANNHLESLDVSRNTALIYLECRNNHLTELYLGSNTSLRQISNSLLSEQERKDLKLNKTSEGYEVNMKDYVADPENVIFDYNSALLSYNKETGIAVFCEPITALHYEYKTHRQDDYGNDYLMYVKITSPLSIAVLERSSFYTYDLLIADMNDNSYFDSMGNTLTESTIYEKSYRDCGKLGLAADGNSRLILRAQTSKPGKVSCSFNEDIGAKLESLASRKELSASDQLSTTEMGNDVHQVSAVLVAPESFPNGKKFPSDTFKVHVKFIDEDGNVTDDDLELKIVAAPVLLIPGIFDNAYSTFGISNNTGVWRALLNAGFDETHIDVWDDYDRSKSPNELLASDNNGLFKKLTDTFNQYASGGIVCTKADIVAHGLGGLMARRFLHEADKDSDNGNNWSVCSYKQGMVRRLITVATPHKGIPWAENLDKRRFITMMYGGILNTPLFDEHPFITSVLDKIFIIKTCNLMVNTILPSPQLMKNSHIFLGSAWQEMKTTVPRSYGMPAGVPMHAIYGNIIIDGVYRDTFTLFTKLVEHTFDVDINIYDMPSMILSPIEKKLTNSNKNSIAMMVFSFMRDIPDYTRILLDLFSRELFGSEVNDLIVSASSASFSGRLKSSEYVNTALDVIVPNPFDDKRDRYSHWSICKQLDVGQNIASLLKGSREQFTVFDSEVYENVNGTASLFSNTRELPDGIDESAEFEFSETLGLKVTPSVMASGNGTVKFTVTSRNPVMNDVYCTFGNDNGTRLFKMPASDGSRTKFEAEFNAADIFSSINAGVLEAVCMSCMSDDTGIYGMNTSNTVHIGWLDTYVSEDEGSEYEPNIETKPEIITSFLPSGAKGTPYSFRLTASGTTPITWSLKSGKMPAGLKLDSSGLISGTPTKAGKFTLTFKAVNSTNKNDTAKLTFQVFDPVSITTASLKADTIGKTYSVTLKAKGTKPITWSAEGLPSGLTINTKTGKISGKPTEYGQFSVNVTAENAAGSVTRTLPLTVKAIAPTLSGSLKKPTLNMPYSSGLKLSKGTAPITWTLTGTLPEGLTFDTKTGIISGTPTSYAKSGYKITITAENSAGKKSKRITLKVNGKAPVIKATLPKTATYGQPYNATLKATGSTPIKFTVDRLPAGLSLNGDVISGTVTETTKSFKFTVYAENPVKKVKKSFTIKINNIPKSAKETPSENTDNESNSDNSDNNAVEPNVTDNTENQTQTENPQMDNHSQTESQKSGVPEGYVIVVELGTVSRDEAGMYDFDVTLSEDVPAGAELMYIANSEKPSDDDKIAEFYDDTGKEITCVPESRKIIVSVWLNSGIVYEPALAVKR